jgi:F-type H+-transporting ATPase subunit delta
VRVSTRVDPSIIGGVVARVGSTVFDGSVTSQLARMRQKLVENV